MNKDCIRKENVDKLTLKQDSFYGQMNTWRHPITMSGVEIPALWMPPAVFPISVG